ncbi:Crp/Fnr family transcriptional regulator [Flavobacterium sp. LM4]|uniref:Crp/Fnr family transcriptional regulator n=1 Tax=Flavobacterium sp. LM4 TaxID=1938609 RepID=UPI000991C7DC|nr:Crp/Fnr family transcriptional regulator [Flavobacterium sp. LM4]OOV20464.1 cyclic nucleotide-binding protein [Flavobacterium sp. LM4]
MYDQLSNYIKKTIEVSDEDLSIIMSFFKPLRKNKNELLITPGQISQHTYFVIKGCLRIFFENLEGKEVTRYIAFEGQFATALIAYITKSPSTEYIQALENSEILYITHNDFNHLLEIVPNWRKFYINYLEKAYVSNANRVMSITTLDAVERYHELLKINPKIVSRLPRKIVSSYINVSQETLSRLKAKLDPQ